MIIFEVVRKEVIKEQIVSREVKEMVEIETDKLIGALDN